MVERPPRAKLGCADSSYGHRMTASRHERSFHNHHCANCLSPPFVIYELPGAPRQIPLGSNLRVQSAD